MMVNCDDLITFVIKKVYFYLDLQSKSPDKKRRLITDFARISKNTGDISLNCVRQFATMHSMV